MLSLLFLPRLARQAPVSSGAERPELADLRRDLDSGDATAAESRQAAILARYAAGPIADEAQFLLARSIVLRARDGVFPGAAAFRRAWRLLSKLPRTPETQVLRREAAALMSEYGLAREAVDHLRELAR